MPLLQVPGLIRNQDRVRFAETVDDGPARVVTHRAASRTARYSTRPNRPANESSTAAGTCNHRAASTLRHAGALIADLPPEPSTDG